MLCNDGAVGEPSANVLGRLAVPRSRRNLSINPSRRISDYSIFDVIQRYFRRSHVPLLSGSFPRASHPGTPKGC